MTSPRTSISRALSLFPALAIAATLAACVSNKTTSTGPTLASIAIEASTGTPQHAAIGSAFGSPLAATVTSNGSPASGVSVTFTAPSSGAGGTFATSTPGATDIETTNSSGVATSKTFTANSTAGAYTVTATVTGTTKSAGFSLTNTSGSGTTATIAITATGGTLQSAAAGSAFASPLTATVTSNGSPANGVLVTFTAPSSGASGTFATSTPGATDIETTNSSGVATSKTFTANGTAGSYTVTASAAGAAAPASFTLSNTASVPARIAATSGATQTAPEGAAFATGLAATVVDSKGNPVSGVYVTFTAPATGASGTFASNGSNTETDQTISGVATASAFTANSTSGSYVVTASVPGVSSPADFNLTNSPPLLANGNYVFYVAGWVYSDVNSSTGFYECPYFVSGALTILNGKITAGEQDFVDCVWESHDQINPAGSALFLTADGNLQLELTTCARALCGGTDSNVGVSGVETFNAVLAPNNSSKALMNEFDASASGSGELDLQNATAAAATPSAGYAFELSGLDPHFSVIAMGGVLDVDGVGTISGTNSIFDANDDLSGTRYQAETFSASTVGSPDTLGRVIFSLNATDTTTFPSPINITGYIVDASRIRLVETTDTYDGTLGGLAFSQGAATGTFSSSSLSGTAYVTGLRGTGTVSVEEQAAGLFAANATSISGYLNFNDLTASAPESPNPVSAPSYTVDSTGRVTIANITDPSNGGVFNLQMYLDGQGNALAITLDTSDELAGTATQQTPSTTFTDANFTGPYALDVTGWDAKLAGEFDGVGPITATGTSDTFSGFVDLNWLSSTNPGPTFADAPLSGTYTYNSSLSGVLTPGTITGVDVTKCPLFDSAGTGCTADSFNIYLIDPLGDSVIIETDTNQLTLGTITQQ